MSLLKELLQLREAQKNHMGELEYTNWSSWKAACKKNNPEVWFDGNQDICNAFIGPKPYKRGETLAIGEWDGEKGSMFKDVKRVSEAVSQSRIEADKKKIASLVKQGYFYDEELSDNNVVGLCNDHGDQAHVSREAWEEHKAANADD